MIDESINLKTIRNIHPLTGNLFTKISFSKGGGVMSRRSCREYSPEINNIYLLFKKKGDYTTK